jgi:hypothetical protein
MKPATLDENPAAEFKRTARNGCPTWADLFGPDLSSMSKTPHATAACGAPRGADQESRGWRKAAGLRGLRPALQAARRTLRKTVVAKTRTMTDLTVLRLSDALRVRVALQCRYKGPSGINLIVTEVNNRDALCILTERVALSVFFDASPILAVTPRGEVQAVRNEHPVRYPKKRSQGQFSLDRSSERH